MQWWVFTCVFRVSAKYLWTRFQPLGRHMIIPAGKEFWAAKGLRFLHPNFLELETCLLPLTMPDSSVTCIGQYDVPLCICLVSPKILLFVRCVNTLKHCFTPTYMANEWMINPDPHMFHPPPIGANNGVAYICAGGNGGPIAINNYKMCLFQNDAHHFWQYLVLPCKKVKFPHCMTFLFSSVQQTLDTIPYVAVTFGIVRMLSKRITWLKSILKYWNSIRLLFAPTKSINLPTMRSCAWPGRDVIDANILETATSAVSISWKRRWVVSARFFNFSSDRKDRRNEWKKRWASHEAGSSTPIWVHLMFLL